MSLSLKKYSLAVTLFGIISLTGCVSDGGGNESDRAELIESTATTDEGLVALFTALADNVVIPTLEEFELTARVTASSVGPIAAYCDAIGTGTEASALLVAQQSWSSVMSIWQRVDAIPLGPLVANGGNLRNRLYSWPEANQCSVDSAVVSQNTDNGFTISTQFGAAKGIDALEYLLFNNDLTHSCPSQIPETQTWNDRSELERQQFRCAYAEVVVADIAANALELQNAWLVTGGNYRSNFINSGTEASTISTQEDALIAILDAIFYLDTDVKGKKLGIPTGLVDDCSAFSCPDAVEAPLTTNALDYVLINLQTFRAAFTGSYTVGANAVGIDDEIISRNLPNTTASVLAKTDALITLLEGNSADLASAVSTIDSTEKETECINSSVSPSTATIEVCGVYGYLREITDELRGDVLTILSLDLPDRVGGDAD